MAAVNGDVVETLGRPEYSSAVQWSEDNLLAVAAGPALYIVNPSCVTGPRGSTALPEPSLDLLQVDGYPREPKDSSTYASNYMRTRGMCSQRTSQMASSKLGIRSICWSPLGCDMSGNALLTSITENHQLRIHSPPAGSQAQWNTVTELCNGLKRALQQDQWQSVDNPPGFNNNSAHDVPVRLRGGGQPKKSKQEGNQRQDSSSKKAAKGNAAAAASPATKTEPPAEMKDDSPHQQAGSSMQTPFEYYAGDHIEVMNAEEGLQGSWFTGSITELQHGFALVTYDELMVSEDTDTKLQEWFPLPQTIEDKRAELQSDYDAHFGPGFKLRPIPSAELAVRGGARAVGDDVDAWDDGAWWEGCITQALKARYKVQPFASTNVLTVKKDDVRTGVVWDGQQWQSRQPRETKSKAEAKQASRKRKTPMQEEQEAAADPEAAETSAKKGPKAEGYKLPEGFSAADLPGAEVTANKTGRASLARASAAQFFALRQEVPAEQLPSYKNHKDQLAGVDANLINRVTTEFAAAYADAMAEHDISKQAYVKNFRDKLRLCWDRVLDPTAQHVQLDKRVRGAQANVDLSHLASPSPSPHPNEGGADSGQDSGDKKATQTLKVKPAPYQVPESFDRSVLGEVDVSSKESTEAGLANAFWLRWMHLREQIPEEKRESYAKGQHLRGADAVNADRTRAEIVAAFGEDMKRHGMGEKQLVMLGKQLIRSRIIQTQAVFASKPKKEWTGQEEQQLRKLAKRRRQPTGMSDDDALWEEVPAYTVSADFDKACLGDVDMTSEDKARKSLPRAFKHRWLHLRSQMSQSLIPVYTINDHFQGVDAQNAEQTRAEVMSAYGPEMQSLGLTEAWLMTAGKQLIWQRFLQAKLRRSSSEAASPAAAAGASATAAAASADTVYEVPADFDPAVLGEPDFSSQASGEKALAVMFVRRWWELRDKGPEAQHESYKKGQHLKGVDAANAERVRAEMMSAFGEEMQRLNITEKVLLRDGKRAIRAELNAAQRADAEPETDDHVQGRSAGNEVTHGKRQRRKAAASASKAMKAAQDSPEGPSSDDEYKGDTEQEDDALSLGVDADSGLEAEDGIDGHQGKVAIKPKRKKTRTSNKLASVGGSRTGPDKPVPLNMSAQQYLGRMDALALLQAAWSPVCHLPDGQGHQSFALLAAGCKAGIVWVWRYSLPPQYAPLGHPSPNAFTLIGGFRAQRSHVTALAWATLQPPASDAAPQHNPQPTRHKGPQTQDTQSQLQQQPTSQLMLVTGSSDGCLRLHGQSVESLATAQLGKAGSAQAQSVESLATAQLGKAGSAQAQSVGAPGAAQKGKAASVHEQSVEDLAITKLGKADSVQGQSVEPPATAQIRKAGPILTTDLMQLLKTLHDVDLLGVTCVSVKPAAPTSTDAPRLLVAAGKSGGALLVCSISPCKPSSGGPSASPAQLHLQYSPVQLRHQAHSTRHVTSIAWAATDLLNMQQQQQQQHAAHRSSPSQQAQQQPQQQQSHPQQHSVLAQHAQQQQQQQQPAAMLLSTGADGKLKQWRVSWPEGQSLQLMEVNCPKAWNSPSLEKDSTFLPGGLAVSGNSLMMAVAVDNGTTAVAAVQQDMIYKRLYNGNLVLRSLCGSLPCTLDSHRAATAVAAHLAGSSVSPTQLWDLARMLKQHAQAAVDAASAAAVAGHGAGDDDDDTGAAAGDSAAVATASATPGAGAGAGAGAGVSHVNGDGRDDNAFERGQGDGVALDADDKGLKLVDTVVQAAAEGPEGLDQNKDGQKSHGNAVSSRLTSVASSGMEEEELVPGAQRAKKPGVALISLRHADKSDEHESSKDCLSLDQAVAQSSLVQAVLDCLEQPYYQLAGRQGATDQPLPSAVHQGLQYATALRHLLHPARLLPSHHEIHDEPPWQQPATATHAAQPQPPTNPTEAPNTKPWTKDWEQQLERNELQLLQLHIMKVLRKPRDDESGNMHRQVSELLLADWVSMHDGQSWLLPGLMNLAQQVYARYELPAVTPNSQAPSREVSDWFGVELLLAGSPLGSAQFVPASKDVPICLQRCAASLLICETTQVWRCQLCSRRYKHLQLHASTTTLPTCLCCGINLGVTAADQALRPPAML